MVPIVEILTKGVHESSEETADVSGCGDLTGRRKLRCNDEPPAHFPLQPSHRRYFFEKFGITERLLERCLGEALSAGGDYADLYFESVTSTSWEWTSRS